jgi:hypothetical protein
VCVPFNSNLKKNLTSTWTIKQDRYMLKELLKINFFLIITIKCEQSTKTISIKIERREEKNKKKEEP